MAKADIRIQASSNYQVYEITFKDVDAKNITKASEIARGIAVDEVTKLAGAVPNDNKGGYSKGSGSTGSKSFDQPASAKQIKYLKENGVKFDPDTITKKEASALLEDVFSKTPKKSAPKATPTEEDPYKDFGESVKIDEDDDFFGDL